MKPGGLILLCGSAMLLFSDARAQQPLSPVAEREYVGNVVGSVLDSATGQGISGVTVLLLEKPWQSGSAAVVGQSRFLERLLTSSVRWGRTGARGRFLINRVPTPYPSRDYTVVAVKPGYKVSVFDQIPVPPGAVMSLECEFALKPGSGMALVFRRDDPGAHYYYSHERRLRIPKIARDRALGGGARIFATREGLAGRTTANGHVIRARDRFVALPSRRALSSREGREFEVRLTYKNKSVVAPVWDVGPWNIRDDHWNPSSVRERWRDLPQGLPEAQAAFSRGYNGGRDGFGRKVLNPAGIDLSDRIFWNDLRMRDNDWVAVEYLWLDRAASSTTDNREPSRLPRREPGRRRSRDTGQILADILSAAKIVLERPR